MSSYSITAPDQTTLPDEMLAMTKKHLRVDFPDDDEAITEYLAWSIGYLENFWSLQVFGTTVTFLPDAGAASVQSPVQPVSSTFTASDAGGDVTADYRMQTASLASPVWLSRVDGAAIPAGVSFVMQAGYTSANAMPAAMRGGIVRLAATLYEYSESVTSFSLDPMPAWLSDVMGGLWIPRA